MSLETEISPHERGIEAAALRQDDRVNRRQVALHGRSDATMRHWRDVARRMVGAYLAEVGADVVDLMVEHAQARAEVKRLRAALKQIADSDLNVGRGRYDLIEIAVQTLIPPADSDGADA